MKCYFECPKCGGRNFTGYDDCSGASCQKCGCFVPDGDIDRLEAEFNERSTTSTMTEQTIIAAAEFPKKG